jgi:hypothetical protein
MNEKQKAYCRIDQWYDAGYTGKGIKIGLQDLSVNTVMPLPRYEGKVFDPFGNKFGNQVDGHIQNTLDVIFQVAPDVKVYLLGGYTSENLAYCRDNGIDLYNFSLDSGWNNPEDNAIELQAQNNGTFFGCSAGNRGSGGLSTQAQKPNWLSVGAVEWRETNGVPSPYRASYSSYDRVGSTDLDVMGFSGLMVLSERYGTMGIGGTSFSHPWVTGMIALYKQWFFMVNNRKPTYAETYKFVISNCFDIESDGYDNTTGFGIFRLPEPSLIKKKLEMWVGSNLAKLNGVEKKLAVVPKVENGSTVVGLRDIGDLSGGHVNWSQAENKITIEW